MWIWYSTSFYDVYFDDNLNYDIINNDINGSDYIINYILADKLEVKNKKKNMKGAQQKNNIDLNYVDPFDYKFICIKNVGYMDTIHLDEENLRFAFYYSKRQWKRNNLSIVISYTNFKMRD